MRIVVTRSMRSIGQRDVEVFRLHVVGRHRIRVGG
jgi:hypothetical protein